MKRFNFGRVLDGIRSSVSTPAKVETEIEEKLGTENFQVAKMVRHGFPYQPTCMAYDPVQHILAIGTKNGSTRIFGRPGVDCYMRQDSDAAVLQLIFLVNEGALVTVCADDTIHMWSIKQRRPELLHTLKFNRERIIVCHLPFQSKWLYIGTERGNIHIVNIDSFQLSGYVINWNKAIELTRKTHPGPIVHLSDCPCDPNKLLIGFECGHVVLWDLKNKAADVRLNCPEALKSVAWHNEGKQFICSHQDGSLTTWNVKMAPPLKPISVVYPHAKAVKEGGKMDTCKPIVKVEWKSVRNGDSFIVFSGGLTYDKAGRTPSLTVIHGKTTTVLEMEHNIVDFICLCETPYQSEFQEPYAIVVLLENDLVVVDLTSNGYPCFENPYPMDIHESPVTCIIYLADCPTDLIPAFYSVGAKQKRTGFSEKDWPINGGEWGMTTQSYPEIIITGHADGSVKFWDASAVTLQVLYKLKTAKVFDKHKPKTDIKLDPEEDPFAIEKMYLCPESRLFAIAGVSGQIVMFRFSKQESVAEVPFLEVSIVYEIYEETDSPDFECQPGSGLNMKVIPQHSSFSSHSSSDDSKNKIDRQTTLRVKQGPHKRAAGYQADLICLLTYVDGEPPSIVSSLTLNSSYGLLAFGNQYGLAIVDYLNKVVLLNMGTPDLYGSADPYQRVPRSPKQRAAMQQGNTDNGDDRSKSPTLEQVNGQLISISPPTQKIQKQRAADFRRCKSQSVARRMVKTQSTASEDLSRPCEETLAVGGDLRHNKSDSSFSRSRSSSVSSLDNVSSEAIQCLAFADAYTRKTDSFTCPCLWLGTSLGSVLVIILNLPPPGEQRLSQPVIVSPSGTIFRLKGGIMNMAFLDCNGSQIGYDYEVWRETNVSKDAKDKDRERQRPKNEKPRISPTSSTEMSDRQFVAITSEKRACVISLPSQTCVFKTKMIDSSYVVAAEVVTIHSTAVLACYIANGHIMVLSLPSLRTLLDVSYLPLTDLRIARTFEISNNGHALYMCTPTEIQKITYSSAMCDNLSKMLGEVFLGAEMPEAPKQGFFKGLFGSGSSNLDREELFGESGSGKASRTLAQHIPGRSIEAAQLKAQGVAGDVARTRMALIERGEKLSDIEERTAQMMANADNFSSAAHQIMNKYKDKKWYQF